MLHVSWKVTREFRQDSGTWMHESERLGVQCLAWHHLKQIAEERSPMRCPGSCPQFLPSVCLIADNWVTDVSDVDADLMGPSRFEATSHQ